MKNSINTLQKPFAAHSLHFFEPSFNMLTKSRLLLVALSGLVTICSSPAFAQEIKLFRAPMGYTMSPSGTLEQMENAYYYAEMQKVINLRHFGVAKQTVDNVPLVGGRGGTWRLEVGETFRFLGYVGDKARLSMGSTWISVPRESIDLYLDDPNLEMRYQALVAANETAIARRAMQRELATGNAELQQMRQDAQSQAFQMQQQQQAQAQAQAQAMQQQRQQMEALRREQQQQADELRRQMIRQQQEANDRSINRR